MPFEGENEMTEIIAEQEIRTDIPHPRNSLYTRCIKRVLDIVLSGMAILVLSPVLLILMLLELKGGAKA